jgi:hypothetical protein
MRSVLFWLLMLFLVAQTTKPSDWEQVLKIPIPFFTCLFFGWVFMAAVQLFIFEREYRGKLNRLDSSISLLEQQLKAKDNDLKRLQDKNDNLEKQLLNESSPPPQSLLEPVRVVEVSEINQETSGLMPAELFKNDSSQIELKVQAHQAANAIYQAIEKTKKQAGMGAGDIRYHFLYSDWSLDHRGQKYINIVNSVLSFYGERIHENAVALKLKIYVPADNNIFSIEKYTNPQGLRDLEAIAKDLKDIGT